MPNELAMLDVAYRDLSALAVGLDESASWQPSGCPGWAVRDLVFHLLGDAQRALVALATPVKGRPDRNATSYWTDSPTGADPESRALRANRTMASGWRLGHLTGTYADTCQAVLSLAARTPPDAVLATQGHLLRAGDLLTTLTVEAAVHHLDLVSNLPDPGPQPGPMAVVRGTLDGLLGRPEPIGWDDETWALVGSGRRPLTAVERTAFGPDVDRLPLLS